MGPGKTRAKLRCASPPCITVFTPTDDVQVYCSPACRRRASRKRNGTGPPPASVTCGNPNCSERFVPVPGQLYCSRACRSATRDARDVAGQPVCARARKIVFRDKLAAKMALAKASRPGAPSHRQETRAYKCPYGDHWHLTSMPRH